MEQTTVRLPDDIRKCIEECGRPTSEVIRDALRQYFGQDTRPATVDFIKQCFDDHIRTHHSRDAIEESIVRWGGLQALTERIVAREAIHSQDIAETVKPDLFVPMVGSVPQPASQMMPEQKVTELTVEMTKAVKKKPDKRAQTVTVLESLLGFLNQGKAVVSGTIAKETGINAKVVGHILYELGMEPKNTRVDNISGRYWWFDCMPIAEDALKKLKEDGGEGTGA